MAVTPFEAYFAEFGKKLDAVPDDPVFSNGLSIKEASWDRRAAYLLWKKEQELENAVGDYEF